MTETDKKPADITQTVEDLIDIVRDESIRQTGRETAGMKAAKIFAKKGHTDELYLMQTDVRIPKTVRTTAAVRFLKINETFDAIEEAYERDHRITRRTAARNTNPLAVDGAMSKGTVKPHSKRHSRMCQENLGYNPTTSIGSFEAGSGRYHTLEDNGVVAIASKGPG